MVGNHGAFFSPQTPLGRGDEHARLPACIPGTPQGPPMAASANNFERSHLEHNAQTGNDQLRKNNIPLHNDTTDHGATRNVTTEHCATRNAQRAHNHTSLVQRPTRNGWVSRGTPRCRKTISRYVPATDSLIHPTGLSPMCSVVWTQPPGEYVLSSSSPNSFE